MEFGSEPGETRPDGTRTTASKCSLTSEYRPRPFPENDDRDGPKPQRRPRSPCAHNDAIIPPP
jgi:hypothetical protein